MGLFDLFKRPKTEQEQYYENYDRRTKQNDAFQSSNSTTTSYNAPYSANNHFSQGFSITVEDVFTITGRGTVITGRIASGAISVGDTVTLQRLDGTSRQVTITGIEMFRKILDRAEAGDNVGLLLQGLSRDEIGRGDVLTGADTTNDCYQYHSSDSHNGQNFRMTVENVFTLSGRGTVLTGRIELGSVSEYDEVTLMRADGSTKKVVVTGIEMYRKVTKTATEGEDVGLLIAHISREDATTGDILMK